LERNPFKQGGLSMITALPVVRERDGVKGLKIGAPSQQRNPIGPIRQKSGKRRGAFSDRKGLWTSRSLQKRENEETNGRV